MQSDFNIIFEQLIKWFKSNLLFFNFDKTYFIQFNTQKLALTSPTGGGRSVGIVHSRT
jgi:hypothetical protein